MEDNKYVVEIEFTDSAFLIYENGSLLSFEDKHLAEEWGKNNLCGQNTAYPIKYTKAWKPLTVAEAKDRNHYIY